MERDQAIAFMKNDCHFDPPKTDAELDAMWSDYRSRVQQLAQRPFAAPRTYALTTDEQLHATKFLAFLHGVGVLDVQQVVKVDMRQLVVYQPFVVTERADGYRLKCADAIAWMEEILPTSLSQPVVPATFNRQNFDSQAVFDLPHGEFFFGPTPAQTFGPLQLLRHVTAMNAGPRMMLWGGYHRSYACVLSMPPTAPEWPALVALTTSTISPPPGVVGVTQAGAFEFTVWGARPPRFEDFFTDDLRIVVKLRKKRYQLHVQSKMVLSNEP
jgi:hypothetical protein